MTKKQSSKRKPVGTKTRFEVFKRDSFTCQYCGRKAPDVILNADHVIPVAKGGSGKLTNLVTSCFDCNSGKGARVLSDNSVVQKARSQSEIIQEKCNQLKMMLEWQDSLDDESQMILKALADRWNKLLGGDHALDENGKKTLRLLIKKNTVEEIISAMSLAVDSYVESNGDGLSLESIETAWKKLSGICHLNREEKDNPDVKRLYYVRGIIRKRMGDSSCYDDNETIQLLRAASKAGVEVDFMEKWAKKANTLFQWRGEIEYAMECIDAKAIHSD